MKITKYIRRSESTACFTRRQLQAHGKKTKKIDSGLLINGQDFWSIVYVNRGETCA